jgi:hypothetical protein
MMELPKRHATSLYGLPVRTHSCRGCIQVQVGSISIMRCEQSIDRGLQNGEWCAPCWALALTLISMRPLMITVTASAVAGRYLCKSQVERE